jgi:hypothetical protein
MKDQKDTFYERTFIFSLKIIAFADKLPNQKIILDYYGSAY